MLKSANLAYFATFHIILGDNGGGGGGGKKILWWGGGANVLCAPFNTTTANRKCALELNTLCLESKKF